MLLKMDFDKQASLVYSESKPWNGQLGWAACIWIQAREQDTLRICASQRNREV